MVLVTELKKQGNKLVMSLGYSHPVEMEAPEGITFDLTDANHIVVRGIDKELVGQVANEVRNVHQKYIEEKVLNMLLNILDVRKVKQVRNNSKLRLN